MDNLYYTLASLPTLDRAEAPPFPTMEAFWDYVDHVPADWKAAWAGGTTAEPTVEVYRQWEHSLRTALARLRLESLPWKEQEASLSAEGGEWRDKALEALDQPTPFETEKALDALRWEFLEDLAQGHSFDRTAFFVYVLKLELVQRRAALVKEKGLEVFDALHARFLAEADLTIPTGEQS